MTMPLSAFSKNLLRNAYGAILFAIAGLAAAPLIRAVDGMTTTVLWLLMIVAAVVVLVFSAHLIFDALLFRFMSSFADDEAAGRAIDEFFARTGLRAAPPEPRPIIDRMAGTRRVMRRHRIALAIFIALFAAFAFLPDASLSAGGP
jgi:hypothetical protein